MSDEQKRELPKRILGHARIFQAVQADLKMDYDIDKSTYHYEGVDPFQLEDSHFPITVAAIDSYATQRVREYRERLRGKTIEVYADGHKPGYKKVIDAVPLSAIDEELEG